MRRDDRRGGNMKDQRYRDRDVRDRDRDRESRDRDRDRGDRERERSSSNTVSTSNSNSKDRKTSTSSSRSTIATSASSSTRKSDDNHKKKPEGKTTAGSSDEDEPKMSAQELYEAVVGVENEEAKALDVDKHLKELMTMCKQVEMLMDELYELKLNGEVKKPAFSRKQRECLMMLTTIREMNRLYKLRLKIAKDNVSEQRQKVDADHLCLQNLIYEATHLNDQVSAVQDYKGIDEDIDLIPVDQFYKEAPLSLTRDGATKNNPHLLKIARLEYEYAQRQNLTEKCVQLEKEQERISAEILKRQTELGSIEPILEKILEAVKPLEEMFQVDITGKRKMNEMARYLPTPLYTLYVSSAGYVDSLDGDYDFKIKIAGDVEAAKKMISPALTKLPPLDEDLEDVSPMEVDDEEVVDREKEEEDVSRRRKLKKHLSVVEEKIDTRAKIVEKNPLHVEWVLELPDGEVFTFTFYYIIILNIVTVTASVKMKTLLWKLVSFLNKSEQIIGDLFEDDDGEECPNPSADYTLRKADVETFSELIPEIGRPYKWAQKVCGLMFLPEDSEEAEQTPKSKDASQQKIKVSKANVPGALSLLQVRIKNKVSLWKLLRSLESGKISLPMAVDECFPHRDAATFSSMEPLEFGDFQAYECTKDARLEHLARPCNLFLKFIMQRENKKLTALVAVSQDYPDVPPGFALLLKEGDAEAGDLNGRSLRNIRTEVNSTVPQLFKNFPTHILSIQLRVLRDRLDNVLLDFDEVGVVVRAKRYQ